MSVVIGVIGQVGSAVALRLLERGRSVRAIVRDGLKAAVWKERGCELFVADVNNQTALAKAFEGAEGVFVMLPPIFDPTEGFPEAKAVIAALYDALSSAMPARVVALSTIGGHLSRPNLLTQLHMMETVLSELSMPLTILRPGWFIKNVLWDVAPAKETGSVPSFLQPLNKNFPMIAAQDIGREAAELLCENWQGHRVVQLEGPVRVSPNEIAATLAALVGRDVVMTAVPRDSWESTFRSQGMKNPVPRMQMLDGFNEGWIEFEGGISASKKTTTTLREALERLILKAS